MSSPDNQISVSALHEPVLAETCAHLLGVALQKTSHPVLVDATLGMGGHAEFMLERYPQLRLIGIDRDPQARQLAAKRLQRFAERVTIVACTYGRLDAILSQLGISQVDAILADLGVSSLQLDRAGRGFSYALDTAPLDMRMDPETGFSAAEFLNTAQAAEIAAVLRSFGQEKFANAIARRVVETRQTHPLECSGDLTRIIDQSIPAPARRQGGNPAKRSFQALRIAVNDELADLQRFLPAALQRLRVQGRLVIESYQSLEDRLVKRAFSQGIHPEVPPGLPVIPPEAQPWLRDLTRGALRATAAEIAHNPRSKSVRLRAVEKIALPGRELDMEALGNYTGQSAKFPTLNALRKQKSGGYCE